MTLLDAILDRARHQARLAETKLVLAVRHLTAPAVGDNELITSSLEESFERLHRARRAVADFQRLRSRL